MGGLFRTWRLDLDYPKTVYYLAIGFSIAAAPWIGPLGWCVCTGLALSQVYLLTSVVYAILAVSALISGAPTAVIIGLCGIAVYSVWLESNPNPKQSKEVPVINECLIEEGFTGDYM